MPRSTSIVTERGSMAVSRLSPPMNRSVMSNTTAVESALKALILYDPRIAGMLLWANARRISAPLSATTDWLRSRRSRTVRLIVSNLTCNGRSGERPT